MHMYVCTYIFICVCILVYVVGFVFTFFFFEKVVLLKHGVSTHGPKELFCVYFYTQMMYTL